MPKKIKEEKIHHKEAFEIFFLLPPEKRSIREVARQLKKSASTVQSWAESFNWKERVEIRENQINQQFQEIQKQNNDSLLDMKATFHKMIKGLLANAVKDIKSGDLKVTNINELVKLMEIDLNLLGEVDRVNVNKMDALTEAIKQSAVLFGQDKEYVYDGKDRIEGEENDNR